MINNRVSLTESIRYWRSLQSASPRVRKLALDRLYHDADSCLEWPAPDTVVHGEFAMAIAEYCVGNTTNEPVAMVTAGNKLVAAAITYLKATTPVANALQKV